MKSYNTALWLSIFTIAYNFVEGIVSMWFGIEDETLALFGFGADSFIEMLSGIGILVMVMRISKNPGSGISGFEKTALRITGYGFYLLTLGLIAGVVFNLVEKHHPESTFWGAIISTVSILVMYWLYSAKRRTGRALGSEPILADANCTLVCIWMSVVLLVSSGIYELTGFAWADVIGAAGLAWFSFREGRESLGKAAKKSYACCCHGECDQQGA